MARQVLPIVGAVVGAFFGAPQIGFAIGTIIGNAVDPQVIKGPKIGEAGLQTAAEGVYRPIVYRKGAVKGNVMNRGNRQVHTQRTRQSKGGGPVTEQQRVYWTFAIRICEGPIGGVPRIWQDEKLVYDVSEGSTILAESAEFADRFRLYLGGEDQLPDPGLEEYMGAGNVNAYRGTAYIVFPNFDLTDRRESIPDFRFEVSSDASTPYNYLALLHMDEKFTDTSTHLRDEVQPDRWSSGGDLIPQSSPFGINALQVHGITDTSITNFDYSSAIGTSAFCMSAIVFLDSAKADDIPDTVLGHWYQPGTRSFQWRIRRAGTKNIFLQLSQDGTNIVSIQGGLEFPEDTIVHVAVTRDDDGVVRIFQGGILVGSGAFPFALHSNPTGEIGENWVIGGFDAAPNSDCLYGWIKELAIIVGTPVWTESFTPPTAPWPNPAEASATGIALSAIVADLHERVGQESSFYDVSELTDDVEGLVLAGDYTAADAIRTLMPVFFFDASEYDGGSGYRIHYPKRGKPVVATITVEYLLDATEKTVREDAQERPKVLHLHYENPDIGYAPAKATVRRDSTDIRVVGERSIQVPVAFSDVDKAMQIASKLQKVIWTEVGGEREITVSDNLLWVVPGDCIGLVLRGQTQRLRLIQAQIGPGETRWRMLPDRQSAYTSSVTGIPVPPPTPPLPSIVGQTIYEFMDLPALNDNNDRLLWYEAATGQTEAWYGAQTQRKVAPATEFTNSATFNLNTIMGTLIDSITAASPHYPDSTNVVRVQLYTDDVIESLTEQQFLSEGGSFAIKHEDSATESWEILQYRDAVDEGGGVFSLSYLARGRLNTEARSHLTGARFVLLDGVQTVDATTAMIDQPLTTRAVSFGTSPDTATQYADEYHAVSQTEFPVAHLFGEIVGDALNLLTVPRHRFGTEDNPVRSINWSGYRWIATDGANTSEQTTLTDTATFDVTGWSSPIMVTVAQLNRFTGAGPTVTEQFA